MRKAYNETDSGLVDPTLVGGVLHTRERKVVSREFSFPGRSTQIYFSGKLDGLIHYPLTVGVLDFKTSRVKPEALSRYSRQLQAYTLSLEQPASGEPQSVCCMGLMVSDPVKVLRGAGCDDLRMERSWVAIARDDVGFLNWLTQIVDLLEAPPAFSENCGGCALRRLE
jgi:hypothetical protein